MAVYCANDDFCVRGTGFPAYDDVYGHSGVYNLRDYYVGITNGYYIFYDTNDFWCLATTLGGSPCFLQGKYPYNGVCPDLTFVYVNSSICATPTPTPTVGCDVFDFEGKMLEVNPTPTPSYTPTYTPTQTNTPTSSNFCPNIYVDAIITGITPTQTPTPTPTPSLRNLRYRANQIQCNFSGEVTFMTVDSVINCPVSKQFQDCNNGFMYYTTNVIINPSGGDLLQFMIFLGVVDGDERCITYIGNNSTFIGSNNILLSTGPIGYSNLGQCSLCAIQSTPTPTPTMTMTPSSPSVFNLCQTFLIAEGDVYGYVVDTNSMTLLTVPNLSNWNDIANTQTKLFVSNNNKIKEWNIIINPFSATFVRELVDNDASVSFGPGLFAVDNNKLISVNSQLGVTPQTVIEIYLPNLPTTTLNNTNYVTLFNLPIGRIFRGDLLLTVNNRILIMNSIGGNTYLSQYLYPSGGFETEILISPTITSPTSIFVENGLLYVTDSSAIVYNVELVSPFTITVITSPGIFVYGASNSLNCNNISLGVTETTYYIYKLCNDIVGPQNYVYQTLPGLTTIDQQTFYNVEFNNCWSYQGSSTSIPQNTTDDIVIFQGNYFTNVSNTLYTNCTDCISSIPCSLPSDLIQFNFYNAIGTTPTIVINSLSNQEICDIYSDLYNDILTPQVIGGLPRRVLSLSIGSQVYSQLVNNPCNCNIGNGKYFVTPNDELILTDPEFVYIVTIIDCYITEIVQCYGENGLIVNPSSGGSGGGAGGAGGSVGNGGNTPGGGPSPNLPCVCTAVRTISGFQGTAFYTDCDGNPAQIPVPAGAGISGSACFCRQSNSVVTGAVVIEPCQSTFSQGTLNNICGSTLQCS